jgi:hypothetical protein
LNLLTFAKALPPIAGADGKFNIIRGRELRCLCLGKEYVTTKLSIGIAVTKEEKGSIPFLSSEIDLLLLGTFKPGNHGYQ